jgi:LAS superfamily LD-carboxypeptidase LdcB
MLNALELTGRAMTHVREIADPKCVLHPHAAEALLAMRAAARLADIHLEVVSAFRDFKRQLAIWTTKFNGERRLLDRCGREIPRASLDETGLVEAILTWSALPGASRHHWGSEIDVIDAARLVDGARPELVPEEFAPGGGFARLHTWLDANMRSFGFFRPYATDRGGVHPEPWHLSFAPVSQPALRELTPEVVREALLATEMPGRAVVLERLPELYQRYVLAIDDSLMG